MYLYFQHRNLKTILPFFNAFIPFNPPVPPHLEYFKANLKSYRFTHNTSVIYISLISKDKRHYRPKYLIVTFYYVSGSCADQRKCLLYIHYSFPLHWDHFQSAHKRGG